MIVTSIVRQALKHGSIRLWGYVDGIDEMGRVCGWAWDRRRPERRLRVGLYSGKKRVARAIANRYREDLERAGIGDGSYGFEVVLPEEMDFGNGNRPVRVVVEHSGKELRGSRLNFANWLTPDQGRYKGVCESITGPVVRGWVVDTWSPHDPVVVEALDGDRLLTELQANILRKDLQRNGIGSGHHGFCFPLPEAFGDGNDHTLILRVKGSKQLLKNCPFHITPEMLVQIFWARLSRNLNDCTRRFDQAREISSA